MASRPIKVWDLPVRLTHWSLAALVFAMWYTAENSLWFWHTRLGVVLFALVIFRIIWGFVGPETARFSSFVHGPKTVLDYLRGKYPDDKRIGHNPLGAYAVLALLGVMLVQTSMGLFAGDPYDGATGPLNSLVGVMTADRLTDWHEDFLWVVLGMAGLHIAAIGVYAFIKMDDLVGPMLTGKKEMKPPVKGIGQTQWGRAVAALTVSASLGLWIWLGAPPFS